MLISNLLKQEKIFVSFDTFIEIDKGNYSTLFSQTTSYIPLLNYIDAYTGLNRLLYKITKNTSLLCFSNTFSTAYKQTAIKYNEFKIKENNGILEMHYDSEDNIYYEGHIGSEFNKKIIRFLPKIIGDIFWDTRSANEIVENKMKGGSPSVNSAELSSAELDVYNLFIKKIKETYRYEHPDYINIINSNRSTNIPTQELKTIWENIIGSSTDQVKAGRSISYIFYKHIISPKLKNYTIHFDIIKNDFENKNSMININDYNDLKKYLHQYSYYKRFSFLKSPKEYLMF
jgi:hypothetical protein